MAEEIGHVYRVVGRDRNGIVFQRCSERPMSFRRFKSRRRYRRLHLEASPRQEGHAFIFNDARWSDLFGFFLPPTADRKALLQQVRARWGPASEIRKELWSRTKPAFARA